MKIVTMNLRIAPPVYECDADSSESVFSARMCFRFLFKSHGHGSVNIDGSASFKYSPAWRQKLSGSDLGAGREGILNPLPMQWKIA